MKGGISQVTKRYAEANNHFMDDYNPSLPTTFITYQDCNNLYGFAMTKFIPYSGFKWVEPDIINLDSLGECDEIGYILDVDIEYPPELHNSHNDLPLLAENIFVDGKLN